MHKIFKTGFNKTTFQTVDITKLQAKNWILDYTTDQVYQAKRAQCSKLNNFCQLYRLQNLFAKKCERYKSNIFCVRQ